LAAREFAAGTILAEVSDGIGTITFNQPEKHNALSGGMWTAVERILAAWENDDAVRVVVLTGAGDKAFISGADIAEFESRHGAFDAAIRSRLWIFIHQKAGGSGRPGPRSALSQARQDDHRAGTSKRQASHV
jgi:enoyl-CoA hydratase/carnithine racemase